MDNISQNNAVIRHRTTNTTTDQTQRHKSCDQSFDGRVINEHNSHGYRRDQDHESRQLMEYECSSGTENIFSAHNSRHRNQCQHCGHLYNTRIDDDIQVMEECNLHSNDDSSEEENVSCFSSVFGCCTRLPWKCLGLLVTTLTNMLFAMRARIDSNAPAGTVFAFAGYQDSIPDGFLLCNGSVLSINEHRRLFSVIGTTYNIGNENGLQFRLPNYYQRFLQGDDTPGIIKEPGLPNIKGTFGTIASENWFQGAFFEQQRINNVKRLHDKASLVGFDASRSNSIYGKSDTVQPPAATVLYIIKD